VHPSPTENEEALHQRIFDARQTIRPTHHRMGG